MPTRPLQPSDHSDRRRRAPHTVGMRGARRNRNPSASPRCQAPRGEEAPESRTHYGRRTPYRSGRSGRSEVRAEAGGVDAGRTGGGPGWSGAHTARPGSAFRPEPNRFGPSQTDRAAPRPAAPNQVGPSHTDQAAPVPRTESHRAGSGRAGSESGRLEVGTPPTPRHRQPTRRTASSTAPSRAVPPGQRLPAPPTRTSPSAFLSPPQPSPPPGPSAPAPPLSPDSDAVRLRLPRPRGHRTASAA